VADGGQPQHAGARCHLPPPEPDAEIGLLCLACSSAGLLPGDRHEASWAQGVDAQQGAGSRCSAGPDANPHEAGELALESGGAGREHARAALFACSR